MLIDGFTVAAQGVNFLILVWLLKRFLYRPVLAAIDAREKQIAAQLADASAERTKAQQERASYEEKNREFGAEREKLMSAARAAADAERAALLQQARTDCETLHERLLAELSEQRDELTRSIVSRVQSEVFAIARRLMGDLSDRNLEERIVEIFVRRLHSLSDADRAGLRAHLTGGEADASHAITVRSAFELLPAQRASIEAELRRVISDSGSLRYEQASELIGGVELSANGYRLRWSIQDYLGALEEQMTRALESAAEA